MIKIAMINIYNQLNKLKTRTKMVLQVHDELVLEVANSQVDTVREQLTRLMASAARMASRMAIASSNKLALSADFLMCKLPSVWPGLRRLYLAEQGGQSA